MFSGPLRNLIHRRSSNRIEAYRTPLCNEYFPSIKLPANQRPACGQTEKIGGFLNSLDCV